MRILVVGPFPSAGRPPQSGSEIRAHYLATELEQFGFTVKRASREVSPRAPDKAIDAFVGLAALGWADAACVVGVPHRTFVCRTIARALAARKPLVFDYNDDPVLQFRCILGREPANARILETNGNILARRASLICYITEPLRQHAMRNWAAVTKATTALVPNAADPAHFQVKSFPPDNVVGFLGGSGPGRGLSSLLEAVDILQRDGLSVRTKIGSKTNLDRRSGAPEKSVGGGPTSSLVEYIDTVTYDTAPAFLGRLTVCVIPHERNRYLDMIVPIKLFEYMAAGRPVLATDNPEQSAVIDAASAGLVCSSEPQSIATTLEKLLTNRQLAQTLGRNGRRAVEERYNWKKSVADLAHYFSTSS